MTSRKSFGKLRIKQKAKSRKQKTENRKQKTEKLTVY